MLLDQRALYADLNDVQAERSFVETVMKLGKTFLVDN